MASSMPTITWTIHSGTTQHTVRLAHPHLLPGKRQIWVDEEPVQIQPTWPDNRRSSFQVGGEDYELVIRSRGLRFSYFLLQAGQPVPSDGERQQGKTREDLLHSRHLRDLPFWLELAQCLGVMYRSDPQSGWLERHRLVGVIDGYVIIFLKESSPEDGPKDWSLAVKHAPWLTPEGKKQVLAGRRVYQKRWARVAEIPGERKDGFDYTWVHLSAKRGETPAELANEIRAFVGEVAKHARPVPDGVCEKQTCPQRFVQRRKLILLNGSPCLYCPECVASIPAWGEQLKREHRQKPLPVRGLVMLGIGLSIIGLLVWGLLQEQVDFLKLLSLYGLVLSIPLGAAFFAGRWMWQKMQFKPHIEVLPGEF